MNEETRALLAELLCASQKHVYACVCACGMPQMPLPITSFSRALFYFKFGIRISSSSNYLQWSSFFQFRKPRDLFMFFYIKCCFFKMSQKRKKKTQVASSPSCYCYPTPTHTHLAHLLVPARYTLHLVRQIQFFSTFILFTFFPTDLSLL